MDHNIVELNAGHIEQVITVHMRSFPKFFLTFLGPGFLKEFYSSFLVDPAGVGFVGEDARTKNVLGVIAGPVRPEGYFKRLLKRRWWAFCLASIAVVIKRPASVRRLFRAVFYRGAPLPGPPRSLLSSIAVCPDAQKYGIGRLLVEAWSREVHRRGSSGCYLTTDAQDNDVVNNFYQKIGWKVHSSFTTPEGRRMNYYVLDFSEGEKTTDND